MVDIRRAVTCAAAVLLLDASITFNNLWPTPAVRWSGAPSVELAILLVALAVAADRGFVVAPARRLVAWLSGAWLVLVLGRYVDVTAPALWGRELNFYWDLRFLPDVAAMLLGASQRALLLGIGATVVIVAVLAIIYVLLRWAFRQVVAVTAGARGRLVLGSIGLLGIVLFAMQVVGLFGLDLLGEEWRLFPRPVTQVYGRQVRLTIQALSRSVELPPSPSLNADLARVQGADVFLFFIESYGACTYEVPAFNTRLQAPRAGLEAAIRDTGRDVVSAFVESPTFGGSSWFAHISFLSGIKVADPDMNALLMTEQRPTVVTNFAEHGYRTLAMMPGLWYPWPEGAFYGFQDSYNGPRLNYKGPSFGWWDMPDQFTLARLDEQEVSKTSRAPLFVFYPTVSTHTPFSPLAPYRSDWKAMLGPQPFTVAEVEHAYRSDPDYTNLGPAYAESVAYAYETFAGYVRERAGHDYVMILIGDHQPPAAVAGEGAPWDVPMHIITNRRDILDSLTSQGFVRGLTPTRPHLGDMHEAVPRLLKAFSAQDAQ